MDRIVQDLSVLRQKSESVVSVEEATDLISRLKKALDKESTGIGLAAIQIGHPKTVGVINTPNGVFHLINPEIISKEDEFIFYNEGCLSLPGIRHNTKRYKHIVIKNHRIEDNKFEEETLYFYYSPDPEEMGNSGLIAIAVQHEIDHFNGNLILDNKVENKPVQRESKKVGRNDPCPCGKKDSNGNVLKYKKCCGK